MIILFSATQLLAVQKKYGSFILDNSIPDTLFFIDEIEPNDSFEMRKALRNHDIKNIVLASPGGSVWEGLQVAGIIFDKKLRTYIPKGSKCASACAFLFFAGNERLADGELGVHQAYSSDGNKKQAVGQTQYSTQFTVSEIIGFLNEFGTPAFVYERMFQDIDMYYFDPVELMEINSDEFSIDKESKTEFTKIVLAKMKEPKKVTEDNPPSNEPKLTEKELIALIQTKLKEIGCNPGPVDGVWGRKTNIAAVTFAKKAGLPTSGDNFLSEKFFKLLSEAPNGYCPKPKINKVVSFGNRYYYKCKYDSDMDEAILSNFRYNEENKLGSYYLAWNAVENQKASGVVNFSVNRLKITDNESSGPIKVDARGKVLSFELNFNSGKYCSTIKASILD